MTGGKADDGRLGSPQGEEPSPSHHRPGAGERSQGRRHWHAWVPPAAGLLAVLIALVTLAGWWLDLPALTRILPELTPLQPLAAAGILVAGLGLVLLEAPGAARWRIVAGMLCAAAGIIGGAAVLLEYLLARDLGIGWLLFPRTIAELQVDQPGRPSQISSVATIVSAMGLVFLRASGRPGYLVPQAAGALVALMALPVLVGNLYGIEAFYAFAGLRPTSLGASLGFIFLGIGLLFARPARGPVSILVSDDLGGRMVRRLVPVAVLLPLVLGWMRLRLQEAGVFGTEVGTEALVLTLILLLVGIIAWTGRAIQRVDAARLASLDRERRARRDEQAARREIEALLESTSIGVYGLDLEGRCTLINKAGARMLGYEREELLGRPMHDLIHHSHADGHPYPLEECPIYSAFRAEVGVRIEDEVLWRADGSSFPAGYSSSPIREDGTVVGAVVTFVDISARKRAEEEALRARALMDGITRGTKDMIAAWDEDYRSLFLNEAYRSEFEKLWGSEVSVGDVILDALKPWPEQHRKYLDLLSRALNGESFDATETFGRPGSRKRVYDMRVNPVEDARGRLIGAAHSIRDVTARVREQDASSFLAAAGAELAATLEPSEALQRVARLAVPKIADYCLIHTVDPETKEPQRAEIAGPDPEKEVLARELAERLRLGPTSHHPAAGVLLSGEARLVRDLSPVLRHMAEDEAHLHALQTFDPCCAAIAPLRVRGRVLGAMTLIMGRFSDRVFDERDLDLLQEIADRTALTLDNARLYAEARRRAREEAALRAVVERRQEELQKLMAGRERLVRGFSHDVKNPLGAADGQLQLLELGVLRPLANDQAERVTKARRSIARAVRLIGDLTELARADAEEMDIERGPMDMRDIVRELADEHRGRAETKGLRLDIELPAAPTYMQSDSSRVRQILGNLVSNAVKYTPSGRVDIEVLERHEAPRGGRVASPGPWIVVEVRDTGTGIPEGKEQEVFEEFIRYHQGTESGAGIGLAISRRIARLLGGDIVVRSREGGGSVFSLWLPRNAPAEPEPPKPDDGQSASRPRPEERA